LAGENLIAFDANVEAVIAFSRKNNDFYCRLETSTIICFLLGRTCVEKDTAENICAEINYVGPEKSPRYNKEK
jgi:hypothetical protein